MKRMVLTLILAAVSAGLYAQQSHVNVDLAPQKNTENITPFGCRVISPEVHDDHTVTFRLHAPQAEEVLLTGSMFVGPDARKRVPFTKGEDGMWTLTIGPLAPEIYFYYFIIDGVQNIDPDNTYTGHACMPSFSILHVHGDEPAFYDPKPEVPHGSLTTHYYYSEVTGGLRDMIVYTPAGYDPSKKYPVLYLMGGSGDLTETWVMHGKANFILDNVIAEGKAVPMIVVFPNDQNPSEAYGTGIPSYGAGIQETYNPFCRGELQRDQGPRRTSDQRTFDGRTFVAVRGFQMHGSVRKFRSVELGYRCERDSGSI